MTPRRPLVTRRRVLAALGGTAAAGVGAFAYAKLVEPHWVEVVRRDMPLAGLPGGMAGRTLAHVSDLHVGPQVDAGYLADALRRVSALAPDLVAVTGDFMSCHGAEQVDEVTRVMEYLARPPLGCFAALGNHDYGAAWSSPVVADRLAKRLDGLGITVLRNSAMDVGGVQVAGLDDLWGPRFDPARVLPGLDPARGSVVLCHNPDAADRPVWGGVRGWVLAGHTHGGQCKPPFLPPPLLPVANRRYTSGAFDLGGGRSMYISRGLGHLLKARFNARPEITLFRLVPA